MQVPIWREISSNAVFGVILRGEETESWRSFIIDRVVFIDQFYLSEAGVFATGCISV